MLLAASYAASLLAAATAAVTGNEPMPLYLLSKEMSVDRGAVCLDGSPPGFYASFANNSATATSWVLYFKGGGWCYDEASCAARANTNIGTVSDDQSFLQYILQRASYSS